MTKLLDGFFLLRIPLLAPVWTILLLGWITGNKTIHINREFVIGPGIHNGGGTMVWLILLGFSLIVASIYVVNQIVDIESDRINGKLFILPYNFISIRMAWIIAAFCAGSGLSVSLLFDHFLFFLFLGSLILGALYNLPPTRLKDKAWGGVIANALGHGMLTFFVGWYAAKLNSGLDFHLLTNGFVSSIGPALANGAVFLATTIPDASGDKATGKQTFCVKYGEKLTSIAAAFFCAGAFLFSFMMEHNFWVMAIPSGISLVFFIHLTVTTKREQAFRTFKWPVFLLSLFVMLFMPLYGLLIFGTFFGSRLYYQWRFNIEYPTFKAK